MRDSQPMQLSDYVSVLRRRKTIILLAALIVAGTALLVSVLQTPVYEGRARLLLERSRSAFDTSGQRADPIFVDTEIQVIQSAPVREAVRKKLGQAPDVSASAVGQTAVIEVRAQSTKRSRAAEYANGYVEAYTAFRRQQTLDALASLGQELQLKIDALQKEIDDLAPRIAAIQGCNTTPAPSNCAERDTLQKDRDTKIAQQVPFKQRLDQLQVDQSVNDAGVKIVSPAAVPTEPIRPRPIRNGVMGVGAGLVFGVALAFLFEHLDDSIKEKDDFERVARGVPVLGIIPYIPPAKAGEIFAVAKARPSSAAAEAYRTLRTSIEFVSVDRSVRTLQVTSPSAADGKSTTAANIAVTFARAGKRVVLVSCDLRRPRLHNFFGLSNAIGFTSLLLGETTLSSTLQAVPGENNLLLLGSGPLPPNPSELLSAPRTSELFDALARHADLVVVDCPPVLPVTDAAVLSAKVNATLLVITMGSTTRKQLGRTLEILNQVNAPIIGAVLNGVRAESGYGYGYGEYYAHQPSSNGNGAGDKRGKQGRSRKNRNALNLDS